MSLKSKLQPYLDKFEGVEFSSELPTEQETKDLEKSLGVNLPRSYKEFLQEFGYLTFEYVEIYGYSRDGKYSIVNLWKTEREFYKFDNKVIPFYALGNGDYDTLNLLLYNAKTQESPAYELNHEELIDSKGNKIMEPNYSNIAEFETVSYFNPAQFNTFEDWLIDKVKRVAQNF
jgi:hypothetical protein